MHIAHFPLEIDEYAVFYLKFYFSVGWQINILQRHTLQSYERIQMRNRRTVVCSATVISMCQHFLVKAPPHRKAATPKSYSFLDIAAFYFHN